MLKKLLISFLIGISLFVSSSSIFVVQAAETETWYNQSYQTWSSKVYDTTNPGEIFGERYTAAQVEWIFYSLYSFIIKSAAGGNMISEMQCVLNGGTANSCVNSSDILSLDPTINQNDRVDGTQKKSVLSAVFFESRPISGISYVREKISKTSPVSTVLAADTDNGYGYRALGDYIQKIWVQVRNISFGLFILAVVILSFMIMFRVKISPQVVISVQSAIPKVIMTLVLVTFSYAIAGFLIDIMYVLIGIVSVLALPIIKIIPGWPGDADSIRIFDWLVNGPTLFGKSTGVFGMVQTFLVYFVRYFMLAIAENIGIVGTVALGVFIYILLIIVGIIMAIITSLKIVWSLAKALAQMILLVIVAPLQITAGVFIQNLGFGAWLKSFSASLAVFLVTSVFFLMAYIFLFIGANYIAPDFLTTLITIVFGSTAAANTTAAASTPLQLPLLSFGSTSAGAGLIFLAVSFVIFTLIPKANEVIQGFMTGKPFAYGTAIGEAFGPAKWAWGQTGAPVFDTLKKVRQQENVTNILDMVNDWAEKQGGIIQKGARKAGFRSRDEVKDIMDRVNK